MILSLSLLLLGQTKTCAVLLAGALLFDAPPNPIALAGSATAVLSIGTYASLKVCAPSNDAQDHTKLAAALSETDSEREVDEASLLVVKRELQ